MKVRQNVVHAIDSESQITSKLDVLKQIYCQIHR